MQVSLHDSDNDDDFIQDEAAEDADAHDFEYDDEEDEEEQDEDAVIARQLQEELNGLRTRPRRVSTRCTAACWPCWLPVWICITTFMKFHYTSTGLASSMCVLR